MTMPLITGTGLVTSLGDGAEATWDTLLAGRFIEDHVRAAVPDEGRHPRVTQLALRAAREAVARAGWGAACLGDEGTALVIATSKGPVETWLPPLQDIQDNPYVAAGRSGRCPETRAREESRHSEVLRGIWPPRTRTLDSSEYLGMTLQRRGGDSVAWGLGDIAGVVARELGLGLGPRLTLSAACASGLHGLIRAVLMLRSGEAQRALVVAAEASLHPLFLASFKRLGVLARPEIGCRPFDQAREGFLVSEAAAAVCVEAGPANDTHQPPASGPKKIAIERFTLGSDATHLTGIDPDGATLSRLLRHAAAGGPVDLVHAHGTATAANDPVELAAIDVLLGDQARPPIIYSHKGAIGHSLGASGLVSVVLNWMAHQSGTIPGNVRTSAALPTRQAVIPRHASSCRIRRSVVLAAGFGGAAAAVSLNSL